MGVNLRLLVVVLGLWVLLIFWDVLLGLLGVRCVDQLLLARGLFELRINIGAKGKKIAQKYPNKIQITTKPTLLGRS